MLPIGEAIWCRRFEPGLFQGLSRHLASWHLRQDLLEAILVIFGRRALTFFLFESSWKKMKNDTTFVRMRSGDHLGDAKISKKAPRSVEFNFSINCDRQKQFSQNERRRVDQQNAASDILNFV